jgi:hypothetical protein
MMTPIDTQKSLNLALLAGEEKIQQGDDKILSLAFELAFNMGQKFHSLKEEGRSLQERITLQKSRIELLEATHQEKWTSCLEATKVRMQAISHEISKLIQSCETFKAKYPNAIEKDRDDVRGEMIKSLGGTAYCKTIGTLLCQDGYLSIFKDWLEITDSPIDENIKKHPKYKSQTEIVVASVIPPQALIPEATFPQMAPFVQNLLAMEREVADRKQELHILEQSQELKEKDHQNSMKAWYFTVRAFAFEPCLEFANLTKDIMDRKIKESAEAIPRIIQEGGRGCIGRRKQQVAIGEETERLKGVIGAIILLIQEAIEWAKQGETV